MKLIIKATNETYRSTIENWRNHGRLPLAWVTFGFITGHGWGFLHPWGQQALFPAKGRQRGIGHPDRQHDRFWLIRLFPYWKNIRHPNHEYAIEGRYWYGLAWRSTWGKRWGIWCARWVLLDPDLITHDPGRREDFYGD